MGRRGNRRFDVKDLDALIQREADQALGALTEKDDPVLGALTEKDDPVLAELWDNDKDAEYDRL